MLKSLQLYAIYILKTLAGPERTLLLEDLKRQGITAFQLGVMDSDRQFRTRSSLEAAVNWLLNAQKATVDNGFGSYHLASGWSSSYPETTGYIIPTLIAYSTRFNDQKPLDAAIKAADFLLDIQKPGGAWQGGRINDNRPVIVFNTGQVIRGMIAAYQSSGDRKYLQAAIRAGNWLVSVQHPEGYWKAHALMEQARVYDTFVDAPLIQLSDMTGDPVYRKAAIRNLEWVVKAKLQINGWFVDCDNTVRRNDKPILHTIAYTLDGLLDSGTMLGDRRFVDAALPGSTVLMEKFMAGGVLNGRYDHAWTGREYFICTGGAQMAIVWMKLFREGHGKEYLVAARKMIDLLVFIQDRKTDENETTRGAIPGSFPLWGRYEPFAFPNWATKFFCDALLMEMEIEEW